MMARYSGAAGRGASRTMAAVRRAEAETRQAAYDALGARRGGRRGKPDTVVYIGPPLTRDEWVAMVRGAR